MIGRRLTCCIFTLNKLAGLAVFVLIICWHTPQAKGSQLSKQPSFAALPPPHQQPQQQHTQPSAPLPDPRQRDAFADALRSSRDIDMSLVVRFVRLSCRHSHQ